MAALLEAGPAYADATSMIDARYIRAMIKAREARARLLGETVIADPAWDMTLDLLLARKERRQVTVSNLCAAAKVPQTTALRCIARLESSGILVRRRDPIDRRRIYIDLSDEAAASAEAALVTEKGIMTRVL